MALNLSHQNNGDFRSENKIEFEAPNISRIATTASPYHRHNNTSNSEIPKKVSRQSMGSDRSIAPSTPNRSRLSSINRGNDTPDDSPAVPKFGDWDENDPNSAEGFTQIFQLVRDEKQNGTGKAPNSASEGSYHNGHKQYGKKSDQVCGCFPWGGK